jgi:hypothetical protein
MLLQTFVFGVVGAVAGAIAFAILSWLPRPVAPELIYLLPAAGFVMSAVGNLVNEYFGFYKVSLWRRLFPRKRD